MRPDRFYKPPSTDYFDEMKGFEVKVASKLINKIESYYLYVGLLREKSIDFVFLTDGEIFKVNGNNREKIGEFKKIGISKNLIAWVDFDIG